jgi:hypothetical protein
MEEIPVRTPFLSGLINVGRPAKKVLRISAIILGLLAGQMQIAGTSNVFGYDVILEVEDTLHQAAKASPQWHTHQDSIQRMSTTSPSRLNKPGRLQNTPGTPRERIMPSKLF